MKLSTQRRAVLLATLLALVAPVTLTTAVLTPAPVQARKVAPKRLLVVTVTKGFRHSSIGTAEKILQMLADQSKNSFTVDYARTDEEVAAKMTAEGLKQYDGVVFANTTGDLPLPDRDAFIKWIADGHGFIGTHAASDTFHGFPPYIQMLGGEFKTHGPQVEVECHLDDAKHPATKNFTGPFKVYDEIYQFKNFERARVHGLLSLDAHPNDKTPGDYPVAWCRREGKGRVFYTSLGHREDVWEAEWYQKHLTGGIRWVLGLEKGDDKPQKKSS